MSDPTDNGFDHVAINGSGVEQVLVVFTANVLGFSRGDKALIPVDTPELRECIGRDFVRLTDENGDEIVPDNSTMTAPRGCASCGG